MGANSDLSASASIPTYGWVARERRTHQAKDGSHKDKTEEVGNVLSDEEISQIIIEFRKTYPNVKLETHDDNRQIKVRMVVAATNAAFH